MESGLSLLALAIQRFAYAALASTITWELLHGWNY
jgi:hypothetical protein